MKLIIVLFLSIAIVSSFDFSKYTVIDKETKEFLRMKRQKVHPDSAFYPGVLSAFGNSLTVEECFWSNIPESKLGAVPGTLDSTYSIDYKCAGYGNTIWNASNCVKFAVSSVRPEAVVMMYGTNEALSSVSNQSWEEWKKYYAILLDSLLLVGTIPIISTIPPLADIWDSSDVPVDTSTHGINDSLRSLAKQKHVVLVDYNQAVLDYTNGKPFSEKWYDDTYLHPSSGCEPDTSEPTCGYGIRNAVCWHAVNKVYRIIIDDGTPDTGTPHVSIQSGNRIFPSPYYIVTASSKYGTSSIKLFYNSRFRPQSIRLINSNGRSLLGQVSITSTEARITMIKGAARVVMVETTINGKIYRDKVLLVP